MKKSKKQSKRNWNGIETRKCSGKYKKGNGRKCNKKGLERNLKSNRNARLESNSDGNEG